MPGPKTTEMYSTALIPSVNYVCSMGEQMWSSGKGECLLQTEHRHKVISGTLAMGFILLLYFFFWYHIKVL